MAGLSVNTLSVWTTRLLVLSLPLMFFNSMNPVFHRLQLSEGIALFGFVLLAVRVLFQRERPVLPSRVGQALLGFIGVLFVGTLLAASPTHSAVDFVKIVYLAGIAAIIVVNGRRYSLQQNLVRWTVAGFVLVLAGAIVGGVLLLAGVHSPLAEPTRIIGVALGIEEWVPVTPRLTSFLSPTANLTAAYLAVLTLPSVTWIFQNRLGEEKGLKRLLFLFLIFLIALFTMSRGLIGVLMAIWLGLAFLKWQVPARRFWAWTFGLAAIGAFLMLQLYTIFYPIDMALVTGNDPDHQKALVDLGSKVVPNPVYFVRPGVGAETLSFDLTYAINHYAWLKYTGWEIFTAHPWFGVGLKGFSPAAAGLAAQGVVPADMAMYGSAQSQYFTLLAEVGLAGVVALGLLLTLFYQALRHQSVGGQHGFARACLLTVPVMLVIAIDIDVLSFRWLWGLGAVAYLSSTIRSENDERKETQS